MGNSIEPACYEPMGWMQKKILKVEKQLGLPEDKIASKASRHGRPRDFFENEL